MKRILLILLTLAITISASAAPGPEKYDDKINSLLSTIDETVVKVTVTNYPTTILVIAKGYSGQIYAFGFDKAGYYSSSSDSKGNSHVGFESYLNPDHNSNDNILNDFEKTIPSSITDAGEFTTYVNELLSIYPAQVNNYSDAEHAALVLLSVAKGPGMYNDMLRIIQQEVDSDPDTALSGDLDNLGRYIVLFAQDEIISAVAFLSTLNTKNEYGVRDLGSSAKTLYKSKGGIIN